MTEYISTIRNTLRPYLGIILMCLSALCFAFMNGVVKYLEDLSPYQLVFFRAITSFFLCIAYMYQYKIDMLGEQKKWLILRGLVGTTSVTLFFLAIKLIPLGSAVTLRYLSPIFAAILALIFLGEKIGKIQWLLFFLAFMGAAILKGFDLRITPSGFLLILLSALFSGVVYVIIKRIGNTEHPMVIVGYFMAIASGAGLLLSIGSWAWPDISLYPFIISLGIFGFFGQVFMTMAIQKDDLVKVIPFKYTEVVLVVVIGFVWFGEGFDLIAILGILLIVIAMICNVLLTKRVHPKTSS